MKIKSAGIYVLLSLSLIIVLTVFIGGCDYITGRALDETAAPAASMPRWVWTGGTGGYSIIIDRITRQPIRDIDPEEAFGIIGTSSNSENPVVIDVRTPEEYADGYIRDAVNIDYRSSSFESEIDKLDKSKLYIVYCRSGLRSSAARDIMEKHGFKNVINVTGGFDDWKAAGLPVENPPSPLPLS